MRKLGMTWLAAIAVVATGGRLEADDVPPAPREMRAVWVATVGNIDWPSRPGLSTDEQRREAVAILDRARAMNLNAVIFQVRTSADALYASELEPWSAFLTGAQGKRPDPYYDPLEFWIAEAHRRGLQLHAWFNPYRARYQGAKYEESADHVSRAHPDWVRSYGGMLWMDPGEPGAQEHSYRVFMDVARRYDVDGIHIDDYFYPYPVPDPADRTKEVDFPDEPSWTRHGADGTLARADWRRENINRLIRRIYEGIKAERPHVLFGISPFGLPGPGRPQGIVGFNQYEKLYADAELWLREGWCDYFTPQLYWPIASPGQPFKTLLSFWASINAKGRHLWPGMIPSRIGEGARGFPPEEIVNQILATRATPGATGGVHFSMKAFLNDRGGIVELLREGPYRGPALVPTSPWLGSDAPAPPRVEVSPATDGANLSIGPGAGDPPFVWAIRTRRGEAWDFAVHPAAERRVALKADAAGPVIEVAVSAVDRWGNASDWVVRRLGR